jgi:hypothetical protein
MNAITKITIVALIIGAIVLIGCSNPSSFDPKGGTQSDPLPTEFTEPDFGTVSDGTALEDLGYEVVAADNSGNPLTVPAFVVNGGVIESDTDDLAGWFSFTTSEFEIDRDDNGGAIVEWEVRYPETVAAGDHERCF